MKTMTTWHKLTGAVAAAALAAALANVAIAQAAEHRHDAAQPHKLALDHGRKWHTDAPLREGMGRIRGLVEPRLTGAHSGTLTPVQYRELGTQLEAEVGRIVATCKLEPQADAMLHVVIADLLEASAAMAGTNAKVEPAHGVVQAALALNEYGRYFDHPGFAPLRVPD